MMITSLFKKISGQEKKKHRLDMVYPDDVFLVGYPKSGNTWVRFLIGNYLTNNKLDFVNKEIFIPNVEHPDRCEQLSPPRFLHTHASVQDFVHIHLGFEEILPRIIFLVRDGRDIAVSYYYYLKKYRKIPDRLNFSEFLDLFNEGKLLPYQPWREYIQDWLNMASRQAGRFLVVRYEDLHENATEQLSRVLAFAELELDRERICSAVEASSFDNMRQLETAKENDPIHRKPSNEEIKFMRRGEINQWVSFFDARSIDHFVEVHGSALVELGYRI